MNYRGAYEFDPETYGEQGAGGLLGRLQAMMRQGRAGADPGSNTGETPAYDPATYEGQQGGLIGRLTELQQRKDQYRPSVTQGGGALADQIVQAESHGVSNAENPYLSARGAGQFIRKTWLAMLRMHRPDVTGTPEELLALRNDPELAAEMTEALATDNARILSNAGYEATPRNVFGAFCGAIQSGCCFECGPQRLRQVGSWSRSNRGKSVPGKDVNWRYEGLGRAEDAGSIRSNIEAHTSALSRPCRSDLSAADISGKLTQIGRKDRQ